MERSKKANPSIKEREGFKSIRSRWSKGCRCIVELWISKVLSERGREGGILLWREATRQEPLFRRMTKSSGLISFNASHRDLIRPLATWTSRPRAYYFLGFGPLSNFWYIRHDFQLSQNWWRDWRKNSEKLAQLCLFVQNWRTMIHFAPVAQCAKQGQGKARREGGMFKNAFCIFSLEFILNSVPVLTTKNEIFYYYL